jgi:hypothetical protein
MTIDHEHLDQLVDDALTRWPELVYRTPAKRREAISRAHAAAEYVRTGQVVFVEELPNLIDHWQVNGHRCSHYGKSCDCWDDDAPHDPELGRLCKHRLALIFWHDLRTEQADYLHSIFALCNAQGVQSIKWTVRTHYVHNLHRQGSELITWQPKGYEPFLLAGGPLGAIEFTIRQLQEVLFTARWRVTPGARVNQAQRAPRHLRGREHWFFDPISPDSSDDPRLATMIGHLYGIDATIAEERTRRANIETMFHRQLQEANHP